MQAQLCPSPAPAATPKSKAASSNLTLSACAGGLCVKVCLPMVTYHNVLRMYYECITTIHPYNHYMVH